MIDLLDTYDLNYFSSDFGIFSDSYNLRNFIGLPESSSELDYFFRTFFSILTSSFSSSLSEGEGVGVGVFFFVFFLVYFFFGF